MGIEHQLCIVHTHAFPPPRSINQNISKFHLRTRRSLDHSRTLSIDTRNSISCWHCWDNPNYCDIIYRHFIITQCVISGWWWLVFFTNGIPARNRLSGLGEYFKQNHNEPLKNLDRLIHLFYWEHFCSWFSQLCEPYPVQMARLCAPAICNATDNLPRPARIESINLVERMSLVCLLFMNDIFAISAEEFETSWYF